MAGDLGGVVEDDACRVGVGAVEQDLQLSGAAGVEVFAETLVHPQNGLHITAVEQFLGAPVIADVGGDFKVTRADEPADQFAAADAVVEVVDRGADAADVRGGRVAEHDCLDEGRDEQHRFHPGITEELDELLDQHVFDALKHGYRKSENRSRVRETCEANPKPETNPKLE